MKHSFTRPLGLLLAASLALALLAVTVSAAGPSGEGYITSSGLSVEVTSPASYDGSPRPIRTTAP